MRATVPRRRRQDDDHGIIIIYLYERGTRSTFRAGFHIIFYDRRCRRRLRPPPRPGRVRPAGQRVRRRGHRYTSWSWVRHGRTANDIRRARSVNNAYIVARPSRRDV